MDRKMDELDPMDDQYRDSSEAAEDYARRLRRESIRIASERTTTCSAPYRLPGVVGQADTRYRRTHVAAVDNVQDRFELFLLNDGEKKVTEEPDTRIPSSSIFTFNKEDHTLGNLLSSRLLQSPHVTFSGYKVPHPLVAQYILRIQTDGTLTPRQALMQACKDLVSDLSILSREFTKEWELRKMVGDTGKADDKLNGR